MKKFTLSILKYVTILTVILYILDFVFTFSYYHPKNPRNKISWIKTLDTQDTLDYVIFGNSRSFFHIDPVAIEKETGLHGINLGYMACRPIEVKLIVEEFLKSHFAKKIIVQVDYSYNALEPSGVLADVVWMPFLKEKNVYQAFKSSNQKYTYLRYVPFYRYMKYESKLGFRNVFRSMYGNDADFVLSKGYTPAHGVIKKDTVFNYALADIENPFLKDVIDICDAEEIELQFFTAPYYRSEANNKTLKKYLPNYTDYSNLISERELFVDDIHLNQEGSEIFNRVFYTDLLLEKK